MRYFWKPVKKFLLVFEIMTSKVPLESSDRPFLLPKKPKVNYLSSTSGVAEDPLLFFSFLKSEGGLRDPRKPARLLHF